jgi:mono/diheme cytochrome c family protein
MHTLRWIELIGACCLLAFGLLLLAPPTGSAVSQAPPPTRTPPYLPTATPPTQAGHGKDVFWIHCMPCHGDQGQGLTDEFRFRQYPPEDVDCWKSGCHGARPYENGFTLPHTVPALIGTDTLKGFTTAKNLYDFISKAMPFNAPGSLDQTQYLQLTAFLLESNQLVPSGIQLSPASLADIYLHGAPPTPTIGLANPATNEPANSDMSGTLVGILIFLVIATILSLVTRRRR